jgi:conjugative transfer pilus assembly protein TraH
MNIRKFKLRKYFVLIGLTFYSQSTFSIDVDLKKSILVESDNFNLPTVRSVITEGNIIIDKLDLIKDGLAGFQNYPLQDTIKDIVKHAPTYGAMLALQILSPQISSVVEDMKNWSNEYLQQIQGKSNELLSMMGKLGASNHARYGNCLSKEMASKNWIEAMNICSSSASSKVNNSDNNTEFIDGNLIFELMEKNTYFNKIDSTGRIISFNEPLANIIMNLTGTYVGDGFGKYQIIPSSLKNSTKSEMFQKLMDMFLNGNEQFLYKSICSDKSNCSITSPVVPKYKDGVFTVYKNKLDLILEKIFRSKTLSIEESNFLSTIQLTEDYLFKLISQFYTKEIEIKEILTEYILNYSSLEILNYFKELVNSLISESYSMNNQLSSSIIVEKMRDSLEETQKTLGQLIVQEQNNLLKFSQLKDQLKKYQSIINNNAGSRMRESLGWGE